MSTVVIWFQFPCDCYSGESLNLQFTDLESRQVAKTPMSRNGCTVVKLHYGSGLTKVSVVSNVATNSYLVDPASSHMLVSKIKPCMSKYKYCTAKLQTAH